MNVLLSGISENSYIRGVERYVLELSRHLALDSRITSVTILCGRWQTYYDELGPSKVVVKPIRWLTNSKIARHLFHVMAMPYYAKSYDISHICNTLPTLGIGATPTIVTIHDLAEFFVPEKYSRLQAEYRKIVVRVICRFALSIITVSKFSRDALIERIGVSEDRVNAVYNGCEHLSLLSGTAPATSTGVRYVLYWGVIERTKGLPALIEAIRSLRCQFPQLELVIAGAKGNGWDDVAEAIERCDWISYRGRVDDKTLVSLISQSAVTAFPSLYEGFGFPAIEAFIHCDNVVASDSTALGEIAQDFALLVNPMETQSILNGISELLQRPKRFDYETKRIMLSKFSWTTCASQTIDVYRRAVSA